FIEPHGDVVQYQAVPLARGKQPAEGVDDIAMRLDEGQARSSGVIFPRSYRAHRLRQMLEKRTLALAGAGNGQQVVTQALSGQIHRHAMPGMAGGAELPT